MKYLGDLVVKNGTYKNRDGEEKPKWVQVGRKLEGDYGEVIVIDPHINFAGLAGAEKGGVFVSFFPKDGSRGPSQGGGGQRSKSTPPPSNYGLDDDIDDDIPF